MQLRPTQAQWFETYVPSDQTVGATEALARTGVVQLELDPSLAEPVDGDRLQYFVSRFRELAAAHADDLPSPGKQATSLAGSPVRIANQALYQLTVWGARVDFLKERGVNVIVAATPQIIDRMFQVDVLEAMIIAALEKKEEEYIE